MRRKDRIEQINSILDFLDEKRTISRCSQKTRLGYTFCEDMINICIKCGWVTKITSKRIHKNEIDYKKQIFYVTTDKGRLFRDMSDKWVAVVKM